MKRCIGDTYKILEESVPQLALHISKGLPREKVRDSFRICQNQSLTPKGGRDYIRTPVLIGPLLILKRLILGFHEEPLDPKEPVWARRAPEFCSLIALTHRDEELGDDP